MNRIVLTEINIFSDQHIKALSADSFYSLILVFVWVYA